MTTRLYKVGTYMTNILFITNNLMYKDQMTTFTLFCKIIAIIIALFNIIILSPHPSPHPPAPPAPFPPPPPPPPTTTTITTVCFLVLSKSK